MFERPRDKNGEMYRKHGNTLIRTLRKHQEQRDIALFIAVPLQRRTGGGRFGIIEVATECGISLTPASASRCGSYYPPSGSSDAGLLVRMGGERDGSTFVNMDMVQVLQDWEDTS
jgi:hypothetical protein